jgi:hypothetical protein
VPVDKLTGAQTYTMYMNFNFNFFFYWGTGFSEE